MVLPLNPSLLIILITFHTPPPRPLLLLGFGPAVLPFPVPQRHSFFFICRTFWRTSGSCSALPRGQTDGRYMRYVSKYRSCSRHSPLTYSPMCLYSEIAAFSWFIGPAGGILTSQSWFLVLRRNLKEVSVVAAWSGEMCGTAGVGNERTCSYQNRLQRSLCDHFIT